MHYGNEGLYSDLIWAQLPTGMIQIDTLISIVIAVNLRTGMIWFFYYMIWSEHTFTITWLEHTIFVHVVRRLGRVQTEDFGEAAFARVSSSINSFSCFNISFFSSFFFGLILTCNFFFFFRAFLTLMVHVEYTMQLCAGILSIKHSIPSLTRGAYAMASIIPRLPPFLLFFGLHSIQGYERTHSSASILNADWRTNNKGSLETRIPMPLLCTVNPDGACRIHSAIKCRQI